MDKGIRPYCNAQFAALLPARVNSREGNVAFRKTVMANVMEAFGCTLASAATHYNHSFIEARKAAETDPALALMLTGLGRPEDKKGGRKPKVVVEAAKEAESEALAKSALVTETEGKFEFPTAPAQEVVDVVEVLAEIPQEAIEQKFSVRKVADGTIVAQDLSLADADELVAKAKAAKKSKLEVV